MSAKVKTMRFVGVILATLKWGIQDEVDAVAVLGRAFVALIVGIVGVVIFPYYLVANLVKAYRLRGFLTEESTWFKHCAPEVDKKT
jgi:hypothetical protein